MNPSPLPPEPNPSATSQPRKLSRSIQELNREMCRELILDGAERVFRCRGFRLARMAEIAHEAGVAVGTVYNYFGGKDAIYSALVFRQHAEFAKTVRANLVTGSPTDDLQTFVSATFALVERNRAFGNVLVDSGDPKDTFEASHAADPSLSEVRASYKALLVELVISAVDRRTVRGDVTVGELVWFLQSLMDVAIRQWHRGSKNECLVERSPLVVRLFLDGAKPR